MKYVLQQEQHIFHSTILKLFLVLPSGVTFYDFWLKEDVFHIILNMLICIIQRVLCQIALSKLWWLETYTLNDSIYAITVPFFLQTKEKINFRFMLEIHNHGEENNRLQTNMQLKTLSTSDASLTGFLFDGARCGMYLKLPRSTRNKLTQIGLKPQNTHK